VADRPVLQLDAAPVERPITSPESRSTTSQVWSSPTLNNSLITRRVSSTSGYGAHLRYSVTFGSEVTDANRTAASPTCGARNSMRVPKKNVVARHAPILQQALVAMCRTWLTDFVMSIAFNHTIVAAKDKGESAAFFTELFGLPPAEPFGPFLIAGLDHGASLDFVDSGDDVRPQHYAFLVSEADFDAIYGRIRERSMEHWADPQGRRPGEINHNDGGRGVYFRDPGGHYLEIITRPYGSGG
jgi:catechol 2,3-dioxygenase-like lactoylglutathione lyase family enzyme